MWFDQVYFSLANVLQIVVNINFQILYILFVIPSTSPQPVWMNKNLLPGIVLDESAKLHKRKFNIICKQK